MSDCDEGRIKIGELEGRSVYLGDSIIENHWLKELIALPKIGEVYAHKIVVLYPTKEKLFEALPNIPFKDSIKNVLNQLKGGNIMTNNIIVQ